MLLLRSIRTVELRRARPALQVPLAAVLTVAILFAAMTPEPVRADDPRMRIAESTLKDLSAGIEASLGTIAHTPRPAEGAADGGRVALAQEPPPSLTNRQRSEVESSLHRLRREVVSEQTPDGRQARVNDTLERAGRQPDR